MSSSDESEARSYEFDFSKHCIICRKKIHNTQAFSVLSTNTAKQMVIDYHTNDDALDPLIRDEIVNKLLCEDDLTILNAKYHRKNCSAKLRLNDRNTEREGSVLRSKIQRSMEEIFNFIDDNEENQFNLEDFHTLLREKEMFIPSNETLWNKLNNHYQKNIIIINKKGGQGYCCLKKKKGYEILRENYQEDSKEQSFHFQIIDKVVKILFNEIKEYITGDNNEYPASDSMFDKAKNIPHKLKYLLEKLILNQYRKEKNSELYDTLIISIAHAIMSAMFPRLLISPLHVAVGVALHRKFGSRELVHMCHSEFQLLLQ